MIRVAVIETNVLGVLGYYGRCLECDWRSKPTETEAPTVARARAHRCVGRETEAVVEANARQPNSAGRKIRRENSFD